MRSTQETSGASGLTRAMILAAGFGCALAATPAAAQGLEIGIGAGAGVPVYESAAVHGPGIHLSGYAGYRMRRALQLRGEVSFTGLSEDRAGWGPLRVGRLGATVAYAPFGSGPYLLAGAGTYALQSPVREGDPGLVPGITLGVGASGRLGGMGVFAEARPEMAFSTFGTRTESAPTMYIPVVAGLRLPCCGGPPSAP